MAVNETRAHLRIINKTQKDKDRIFSLLCKTKQTNKSNDDLKAEERLSENRGGRGEWGRGREDTIHLYHMKISQWNPSMCTVQLIIVNKMTGKFTSRYLLVNISNTSLFPNKILNNLCNLSNILLNQQQQQQQAILVVWVHLHTIVNSKSPTSNPDCNAIGWY